MARQNSVPNMLAVSASLSFELPSPSDSASNDHLIEKGEIHPLIPLYPKHKRLRPLSPPPLEAFRSTDSVTMNLTTHNCKSQSFLFFTHPTQTFTTKQICEYVDMIVMRHISRSMPATFTPDPLHLQSIKNTLQQLKTHLISGTTQSENIQYQPLKVIADDKPLTTKQPQKWCTHSCVDLWHVYLPSHQLIHHPSYSIDIYICGFPVRGSVRQDWNTIETDEEPNGEELPPQWFELFFDLMFVAAIVHISMEVADAYHDKYFISCIFAQFGLLIVCWLCIALYNSRFRMTQMCDGLLRFVYMAFVLMMGLSITSHKLFLVSYMFTKVIMACMFIKPLFIARARPHAVYMMIENVITVVFVVYIVTSVHTRSQWIWTLIYCVLFTYSWSHIAVLVYAKCIRDFGVNIPINVPHLAERMGAFVLIILGETIISLMVQHVEQTPDGMLIAYAVTMSWFCIVYCIGKLYFESQPTEHEIYNHKRCHAMSTSVWRARIYKWFHMVLFFGLLGLGFGSKITVHELHAYHGEEDAIFVFMPGISCVVICICIHVIRLTHPFVYNDGHKCLLIGVWLVRGVSIIIMIGILFLWQMINHFVILCVYVFCFMMQIFVDYQANTRLIISKSGADENVKTLHCYRSQKGGTLHLNEFEDTNAEDELDDHQERIECTVTAREMSFIGTF
eukprot:50210_1